MLLTQRTNVLFDETDYHMLRELSQTHKKTIGELIREAVKKTYKPKKKSTSQILKKIKSLSKNMDFSGLNYKELRDYGRR